MKIGILTYHFAINYGAVIQAWALSRHLADLGHDVHIINYDPVKGRLPWWARLLYHGRWQMLIRTMKFRLFRRSRLRETVSVDDVHDIERLSLDAIVVGSDQVWNVDFFKESDGHFNRVYLLCGLSSSVKSIAYAASMGEPLPPDYRWRSELSAALRAFDHRSVRERQAQQTLQELGLSSECVVDPTLLVTPGAYDALTGGSAVGEPYLFSYLLTEIDAGLRLCEQYRNARRCDFRLVTIRSLKNTHLVLPSPAKWLSLLRNAKFVITDSFHGVALSVAFNVPFAVILKPAEPGQNARVLELLENLSLLERVVIPGADANEAFDREIRWQSVNEKVLRLRRRGRSFIEKALADNGTEPDGSRVQGRNEEVKW